MAQVTRLWLVRHGPTHARTLIGRTDRSADLSDRVALSRLSGALPDAPVISSDLRRAVQTADAIAGDRARLPPDPRLREFDYGEWENRSFDDIDGPTSRAFFETPGAVAPPGGESWNAVAVRVNAALDDHAHRPDLIAVCHFGPILILYAQATGLTPEDALAQTVAPLSLTRLDRGARSRVHFVDRAP